MIMTFFIALFILVLQFVWKYVDDMVGKGFEWQIIIEILAYASLTFVPMALPLAVLLASLMTFGNLGEHYELVAIKSTGVSFRRAMMPLVVIIAFISIFAFYFSNNILPVVNLKYSTLLHDIQQKKPALNINEGVFFNELDGYVIRIGKKGKDGNTINNVLIFDHTENIGNNNITIAERGKMEVTPDKRFLIFTLYDGSNYYEKPGNSPQYNWRTLQRTYFKEQIRRIDLSELRMSRSDENEFKNNYQMLNLNQLSRARDTLYLELFARQYEIKKTFVKIFYFYSYIDSTLFSQTRSPENWKDNMIDNYSGNDKKEIISIALNSARNISNQLDFMNKEIDAKKILIAKFGIEWQRKFTLSFACLILFFIGAPLGAIIRKGGLGMPVVFSTIFFIIFHVLSMTGEKFARENVLTPFEGMWMSSLIFLPIGILLTYSATSDSKILNTENWALFFEKMVAFFTKSKK